MKKNKIFFQMNLKNDGLGNILPTKGGNCRER